MYYFLDFGLSVWPSFTSRGSWVQPPARTLSFAKPVCEIRLENDNELYSANNLREVPIEIFDVYKISVENKSSKFKNLNCLF